MWVRGHTAPVHLGLFYIRPLVPHIKSWEPRSPTVGPDGPRCKSLIFHISKFLRDEDTTDELHGTDPTIMMTAVIKRKQVVVAVCHRLWRTLHKQHTLLSHAITSYVFICTQSNILLLSAHTNLIHCYTRFTQV